MKKIINLLCAVMALVALVANSTSVNAGGVEAIDGVLHAKALLGSPADYYVGNYSFEGTVGTNSANYKADFRMEQGQYWGITEWSLNGNSLFIEPSQPLPGFPIFKGTVKNFHLFMGGYSKDGTSTRYGFYDKNNVTSSDIVKIISRLQWKQVFIPYKLPEGASANDAVITLQGKNSTSSGEYNKLYKGFVVSYNPLDVPTTYTIVDRKNNSSLGSGSIVIDGEQPAPEATSMALDIENEAGIPEIKLSPQASYLSMENQLVRKDLTVSTNGATGTMYTIQVPTESAYFNVRTYYLKAGSKLQVWGYDGSKLVLVNTVEQTDEYSMDLYGNTGYKSYVVIVTGGLNNWTPGYYISISYSDYSYSNGGGKGG